MPGRRQVANPTQKDRMKGDFAREIDEEMIQGVNEGVGAEKERAKDQKAEDKDQGEGN